MFLVWGRCQRWSLIPRNDLRNAGVAGRGTWWPRRTPGMTAEFDAVNCRHKDSLSAGNRLIHSVSEGTYLLVKSLMDLQWARPSMRNQPCRDNLSDERRGWPSCSIIRCTTQTLPQRRHGRRPQVSDADERRAGPSSQSGRRSCCQVCHMLSSSDDLTCRAVGMRSASAKSGRR